MENMPGKMAGLRFQEHWIYDLIRACLKKHNYLNIKYLVSLRKRVKYLNPAHKPYYVKRFISMAEKNQNFSKLVFASRNKIVSKSIDYNGSVIQDSESEEIDTAHEGDKEKRSFSNVDFGYDKYFIAYGRQIIKNKGNKDVKRKRKVYFISKIKFE